MWAGRKTQVQPTRRADCPAIFVFLERRNQANDILGNINRFNEKINFWGYDADFVIHTAPLIRREGFFFQDSPTKRRALFSALFYFTLKAPIQYKTFVFEKRPGEEVLSLEGRMSKEISLFLRENLDNFQSFEDVILYYDNGQHELNRILNFALSAELSTYSYRRVLPKDYKLFQSADLICTLKLLNLKCEQGKLSKSEELFFHSIRDLRKQFIKPIEKKKFNSSN